MKRIIYILTVLLLAACTSSAVGTHFEEGPYSIDTISKDVYHIQDCNESNPAGNHIDEEGNVTGMNNCSDMYLLVGKDKALLIDLSNYVTWADNAVESLRKLVTDRIGDKPLTVTFTHNHGDHTGMLPTFVENPDVEFMLPRIDFERLVGMFPEGQYTLYDEGTEFDLGGIKVETVLVQGHTSGSMVFFVEGRDLMMTGDAVGSGSGVWIFSLDGFKEYVNGLEHLISYIEDGKNGIDKDALRIYGGHYWQKSGTEGLQGDGMPMQYLYDMQKLIDLIAADKADMTPYNAGFPMLNANFRYGTATITWNDKSAEEYRAWLAE